MSGLIRPMEDDLAGVDVQERGNSLRVATNSPHLVSLGCGRLSTAVTIHPIKQGRVTIGSAPSSDICIQGTGVQPSHCHIENSHGVVTLYPLEGDTTVDGTRHLQPVRLSQGCMIGVGRSNYLRFNHPAEANLMKSVLPNSRISMAPIHFLPSDGYDPSQLENRSQNDLTSFQMDNSKDYRQMPNGKNESQNIRYSNESSLNEGNSHNVFTDGQKNLEKELDMTYKELSKRKPPVVPRKMLREFDQISNSSNSDQDVVSQRSNTPPKPSGIMSKVSKFEYYVRNSQKTAKSHSNSPQNAELWSPKVFSSNSLTVNTPAKDVLVNKDVPTNYAVNKNQQRVENNNVGNDPKVQRKIVLNENNAVEARNCSYTNVVVKNQVVKIDQMAKSYQGVLSKTQNVEHSGSRSPEISEESSAVGRAGGRIQGPSPSFNRNPVFNTQNSHGQDGNGTREAEMQRQQAQRGRMDDESQNFLEHARLEEIINMCAEYEKQISLGVPTTPTEKKPHNKIITNGSLPRGIQANPNIIQTSDGYFRFDTSHNRSDYSPHRNHPPSPSSPLPITSRSTPNAKKLSNYENVQIFSPNGTLIQNGQEAPFQQQNVINSQYPEAKMQQYSSQHSSYENFNIELQNGMLQRQENHIRQFPITELSSPIMIRKIARNAQNSANYVSSYDKNCGIKNPDYLSPTKDNFSHLRPDVAVRSNTISPYENITLKNNSYSGSGSPFNTSLPKSPSSHSPRTRIKTTYAHKNVVTPQHFVFPTLPPQENESQPIFKTEDSKIVERCHGIEKQLSLTEDIPMIDDTNFANELEMRIAKLKPENRKVDDGNDDECPLLDPDNIFKNQRRNFEEIRRDLIADIPELDAIHRDIDRDLSESMSRNEDLKSNSLNEALKSISTEIDERLEDEVFENQSVDKHNEIIDSPECEVELVQAVESNDGIREVKDEIKDDLVRRKQETECFDDVAGKLEELRCQRKKVLSEIHKVKCKMADIRSQEDDILRELEMEKALLQGEYDSEMAILSLEQRKLVALQDRVRLFEAEAQGNRALQETKQAAQREKVQAAADAVERIEKEFAKHDATLEELRNAQEVLETERKAFEDMEFQDLEEEADWLAYREELQNDISALTQKIDSQKSRILNLRFETSNNLQAAVEETKLLQSEYVEMLNKIEELTASLQKVEEEIKSTVLDIGTDGKRDSNHFTLEERRSRIKSGDFSPPSSDSEDLNNVQCFENRKRNLKEKLVSIDQMSRSMIVDLGEKRSIDDLVDIDIDQDRSVRSAECSPNKVLDSASNESTPSRNERSVSSERKTDSENSADKEKKQGFWERNFDSLSRLKSKDKKSKQKPQDIMWQSLNENLFFNNENIESEYGSFEKCNSLRSSKRSKDGKSKTEATNTSANEKPAKLSFPSLGKLIRKDSFKKSKEDKKSSETNNKENIDQNAVSEVSQDIKTEDKDDKNTKHRYVKNSKPGISENKYLSKCTKTAQQPISINPNEDEMKRNSFSENRDSFADSLDEEVRTIDPITGNTIKLETKLTDAPKKGMFRKSAGDELRRFSGEFLSCLGDNTKVPSQDDIDRISKVTLDAPLLSKNGDMNSLGRRTLDSLREVERNRKAMLEEKGCQVMEDEREKISELKKRVQNEAKIQWEESQQLRRSAQFAAGDGGAGEAGTEAKESQPDAGREENTSGLDDSSQDNTFIEKQLRHSQTDSYNSSAFIEDTEDGAGGGGTPLRPISQLSDMSSENGGIVYGGVEAPRRQRKISNPRVREDSQRPLTRYLPIDQDDLNLRTHIESAGHQVDLCPYIMIDSTSCRGYLHKLGAKFHGWSKRWFVFDRSTKTLIYYSDKSEKKPRGGAYFQVIEEVYLDHLNVSKSPTPLTTFVIKTRQRRYYLMAPSGQAARIWIDVIFTGAQGYTEYMH